MLTWDDFLKVDIRVGTIVKAEPFERARKPAYQLLIDFGELGFLKSSAQITQLYNYAELTGMQVTAVVNFPPKQIANFMSQCLVLGTVDPNGMVTLLSPNKPVENGLPIK